MIQGTKNIYKGYEFTTFEDGSKRIHSYPLRIIIKHRGVYPDREDPIDAKAYLVPDTGGWKLSIQCTYGGKQVYLLDTPAHEHIETAIDKLIQAVQDVWLRTSVYEWHALVVYDPFDL